METTRSISIERRFCGPPTSGNGGFVCGRVAELISGVAEVTLRAPPPLDEALDLTRRQDGRVELTRAGSLLAEGRAIDSIDLDLPAPVSLHEASAASANFIGWKQHPYPTCFVCGTVRPLADGLGLHPGAVGERKLVAAPWTPGLDLCQPDGTLHPRFVWAALDCPSWFGHASFVDAPPAILLGRLAVQIEQLPRGGEPHVVLGWSLRVEGRRILCAAALHDAAGRYLARSVATWITLR
jgi:hypothetical protein